MATIIYPSLDAYEAAREGREIPKHEDALSRFYVVGEFWTGQIAIDDAGDHAGKPRPLTQKVHSFHEAREAARKGWRPLKDRSGESGLPGKVQGMLRDLAGAPAPANPAPTKKGQSGS